MIAQELRPTAPALPFQFLKELRQRSRIVSGLVHNDGAHRIRLRFFLARIFQAQDASGILGAHISQRASRAAQHRTQEAAHNSRHSLRHPGLLHFLNLVLHVHVRHLVRHHARKLRLIVSRKNRAHINKDRATRKRKCVHVFLRDHVKLIGP